MTGRATSPCACTSKYADDIAVRVYDDLVKAIEGRPNTRGGKTQLNMLSTTCHNYFGQVCGASVNGRFAHFAISDGTSPAHGSDTKGPTCVVRSLGKLDQTKSGGRPTAPTRRARPASCVPSASWTRPRAAAPC